jgi:hypothetical protein
LCPYGEAIFNEANSARRQKMQNDGRRTFGEIMKIAQVESLSNDTSYERLINTVCTIFMSRWVLRGELIRVGGGGGRQVPVGWKELLDTASGRAYYAHVQACPARRAAERPGPMETSGVLRTAPLLRP